VKRLFWHPLLAPAVAIAAILIIGQAISPGFASPSQLSDQLTIAAILAVVAAGQTIVILAGREGIDLSVGGVLSLGALIAGDLMNGHDRNVAFAIPAATALGFIIGTLNGVGVTLLRIPPLVVTLGTAGVVQGVLVLLTQGQTSGAAAPALIGLVARPLLFGLPGILYAWAAIGVLLTLLLRRTRLGLELFAIGANDVAARLSGVRVRVTRTLAYGLSGMFAAFGGVLLLGYTGTVFIGVGDSYVLPSVIAVVIGGTRLAGGTGGYVGTMLGAITLTLLQSVLITLNVPAFGRQIIFGVALLGFMLVYGREHRLRQ